MGSDGSRGLDALYRTAREQFAYFEPARQNPAFLENAGGSQVPNVVIDSIADYMRTSYAQLGAGYAVSDAATATVARAHAEMKTFMNAHGTGEVVLGPSTSQLLGNLGACYSCLLGPGDEVIVHEACHEANAGPWYKLAERCGATVRVWRVDPATFESRPADLAALLGPATKLVAVVHVSNILGEVMDLAEVVRVVRAGAPQARVVADGVAYAPHLAIDVRAWGVDWYAFSSYKCWGPHAAVMYGSHAAFAVLGERGAGPNHFWIPAEQPVYKMELGGPSHEACAGIVALSGYLRSLAAAASQLSCEASSAAEAASRESEVGGGGGGGAPYTGVGVWSGANADGNAALRLPQLTRAEVEGAFRAMQAMEQPLMKAMVGYLAARPGVTVMGPRTWQSGRRVPVVSFTAEGRASADIAAALQKAGYAVRNGHMYAYRLLTGMQLPDIDDGVVRISLLHYNTPQEVSGLLLALEEVLSS